MSHHTVRSAYQDLVDRINRFPQGAPPSDVLFAILKLLFSEREAGLVAQLPVRPFTVHDAAARWTMAEVPPALGQRSATTTSDAWMHAWNSSMDTSAGNATAVPRLASSIKVRSRVE